MRVILRCLLTLSLLAGAVCLSAGAATAEDLKAQIRQILKDNPDLVLEVIKQHRILVLEQVQKASREKQELAAKKRLEAEVKKPFKPVLDEKRNFRGNPDALYTIVFYSDFACSYCGKGEKTVRQLSKMRPGQIRMLMKHAPRSKFTKKLALHYEAISRQDPKKAWEFADKVFADQKGFNKDGKAALKKLLAELKIDQEQLDKDLADPKLKEIIKADNKEHNKFGFSGTPTFLVNGVSVRGAYPLPYFEKIIKMLEKNQKK